MLKRFSYFFAYLLLVLMPLQGFAVANMFICNSMMQLAVESKASVMPCHKHMDSMIKMQDSCTHKSACKSNCATLCASLSGMTALTQTIPVAPILVVAQASTLYSEIYTSHSPPNLERPPILLT
jgi:phosphoribosylcarboxyaminoimidazole (NCAIR) mutase